MWISYDFDETETSYSRPIYFHKFYSFHIPLNRYVGWIPPLQNFNLNLTQSSFAKYCQDAYLSEISRLISIIAFPVEMDLFKYITFNHFKKSNLKRFRLYQNGKRYMSTVHMLKISKPRSYYFKADFHDIFRLISYKKEYQKCTKTACKEGFESYYGRVSKNHSSTIKYGYSCQKCPHNFFKFGHKNTTKCQRCPELTTSSTNRESCYSLYRKKYLSLLNPVSIISVILCSFGFIFTFLIISVMLKYRDTPMVKASDFHMSIIHLIFTSLQFIVLLLLFI